MFHNVQPSYAVREMTALALEWVPCALCHSLASAPALEIGPWKVVRCLECGLLYVNPRPSAQAIDEAYRGGDGSGWDWVGQYARMYEARWEADARAAREYLRKIEGFKAPGRLLEVGCGAGAFLWAAKARGWETKGVEKGEWVRDLAQRWGLDIHIGALEEADLPSSSFDVIFSKSLLEHLPDPMGMLQEMKRLLREDGLLVVAGVPNVECFTIRWGRDLFVGNEPPAHLYYFSTTTLKQFLLKAGFRCLEMTSWGLPNDFLRGLLGQRDFANTLSRRGDDLIVGYWEKGYQRAAYTLARWGLNRLLTLLKAGAIIDAYAVKNEMG